MNSLTQKQINFLQNSELVEKRTAILSALKKKYVREYDDEKKTTSMLFDALATGSKLPYMYSSFPEFTIEIEEDIKTIITLHPESLTENIGTMRCRDEVPALVYACANKNIPLSIVQFMLENGADPNATFKLNNEDVTFLQDTDRLSIDSHRKNAIAALFSKTY